MFLRGFYCLSGVANRTFETCFFLRQWKWLILMIHRIEGCGSKSNIPLCKEFKIFLDYWQDFLLSFHYTYYMLQHFYVQMHIFAMGWNNFLRTCLTIACYYQYLSSKHLMMFGFGMLNCEFSFRMYFTPLWFDKV